MDQHRMNYYCHHQQFPFQLATTMATFLTNTSTITSNITSSNITSIYIISSTIVTFTIITCVTIKSTIFLISFIQVPLSSLAFPPTPKMLHTMHLALSSSKLQLEDVKAHFLSLFPSSLMFPALKSSFVHIFPFFLEPWSKRL